MACYGIPRRELLMRKLILMVVLALVGFACADGVGEMLTDAGDMLADGSVPDAGADFEVTCDKQAPHPTQEGWIAHWAEFEIANPGQTEITYCWRPAEGPPYYGQVTCNRFAAAWVRGTNTSIFSCGQTIDGVWSGKPVSITVHD
jgi:hypothetical protein